MKKDLYCLTVRSSFAAAHLLREYQGNCERLHGHNWQVEATVEAEELDARGMALDFREMKAALHDILARLDHKHLNEIPPFDVQNPSSENIARYIYDEMEGRIAGPARLARVTVWESEDARAEFTRRG
jgi:6-pyruvoyltetrahydropterin/6-carboxytetrahydropterin synthase